jgi:CxxC motif-containing protein (DUF1111 family)
MNIKLTYCLATSLLLMTACNNDTSSTNNTTPTYPNFAVVKNLADQATASNVSDSGHGFSMPVPQLSAEALAQHLAGDVLFETAFTTAPNAEHPTLDGLGPVFNNQDCNSCHQRDGRASTPTIPPNENRLLLGANAGLFLRISIDDQPCAYPSIENNYCKNTPVPNFGTQLFHRGVLQARADWQKFPFIGQANVYLSYQYEDVQYPDGETVTLKKPLFTIENPYDSPENPAASALLQSNVKYSARNGLPIFGLGLLELIDERDILALADEHDSNNDGISGRPNWVFDAIKAMKTTEAPISLGRFGWKASTPSVRIQSLAALRGDMGITNPLFPAESIVGTALHERYLVRTNYQDTGMGDDGLPEASQEFADNVVFYAETLAVPARRNIDDPSVLQGASLFVQLNCQRCHYPDFITQTGDVQLGGKPAPDILKGQHIYPFSDMLLHDMGDGLADDRRDFVATGKEWKTRPLWGIGLTKTVNPAAGFLHDGRAASIEEAILWHGGEAEQSKLGFMQLSKAERQNLLAFLQSL